LIAEEEIKHGDQHRERDDLQQNELDQRSSMSRQSSVVGHQTKTENR